LSIYWKLLAFAQTSMRSIKFEVGKYKLNNIITRFEYGSHKAQTLNQQYRHGKMIKANINNVAGFDFRVLFISNLNSSQALIEIPSKSL